MESNGVCITNSSQQGHCIQKTTPDALTNNMNPTINSSCLKNYKKLLENGVQVKMKRTRKGTEHDDYLSSHGISKELTKTITDKTEKKLILFCEACLSLRRYGPSG